MWIRSVGIDLGKTTFHLVALGENGEVLLRKKSHPEAAHRFYRNMRSFLGRDGGMFGAGLLDVCCGRGHDVELIPAQLVKPS